MAPTLSPRPCDAAAAARRSEAAARRKVCYGLPGARRPLPLPLADALRPGTAPEAASLESRSLHGLLEVRPRSQGGRRSNTPWMGNGAKRYFTPRPESRGDALAPGLQPVVHCTPQLRQMLARSSPPPESVQLATVMPTPYSLARFQKSPQNEGLQARTIVEDAGPQEVSTNNLVDISPDRALVDLYSASCAPTSTVPPLRKWLRSKVAQVDRDDRDIFGLSLMQASVSSSWTRASSRGEYNEDIPPSSDLLLHHQLAPNAILRGGWDDENQAAKFELSLEERVEVSGWLCQQSRNQRVDQRLKAKAQREERKRRRERQQLMSPRSDNEDVPLGSTPLSKRKDMLNRIIAKQKQQEDGSDSGSSGESPAVRRSSGQEKRFSVARSGVMAAPEMIASPRPCGSPRPGSRRSANPNPMQRVGAFQGEGHMLSEQAGQSASSQNAPSTGRRSVNPYMKKNNKAWLNKVPYKFVSGKPMSGAEVVRQRVTNAFIHSMNTSTEEIAGKDVLHVLCDLGLHPRSPVERRAVAALLDEEGVEERPLSYEEFEELTEMVREQVMIVQEPLIEKHFLHIHGGEKCAVILDFDAGLVSQLLRSFGHTSSSVEMQIRDELRQVFALCPKTEVGEEHDVFQALLQHTQERLAEVTLENLQRICEETGLARKLCIEFRRELPEMHLHFTEWSSKHLRPNDDDEMWGKIEIKGVLTIMGDLGIVQTKEQGELHLRDKILYHCPNTRRMLPQSALHHQESTKIPHYFLSFAEFLRVVRYVRTLNMRRLEAELATLFDKYVRLDGDTLDLQAASHVLNDAGLAPRTREQQQVIAELFMDLDERGTSLIRFNDLVKLVCRINERKERKTRAQLKAYSKSIGLDTNNFQDYVTIFQDLAADMRVIGQRTAKQVLSNYGRNLEPEAFSKLYAQLDLNYTSTLELPEFLRLLGHLERDRRETEEIQRQESDKKNGGNVKKKATPFHQLPPPFEEFLEQR